MVGCIVLVLFLVIMIAPSCSEQGKTRGYGGTMDLELEPNDKLMEITWKDDSLWILTKAMTEDDVAENYKFYEKSSLGVVEGCVNIKEKKLSKEEYESYLENKKLEEDFHKEGNYQQIDGEEKFVYIRYNEETNTYEKIKDYRYDEYGNLIEK